MDGLIYLGSSLLPFLILTAAIFMTSRMRTRIRALTVFTAVLSSLPICWIATYYALGLEHAHYSAGVGVAFILPTAFWVIALILGVLSLVLGRFLTRHTSDKKVQKSSERSGPNT